MWIPYNSRKPEKSDKQVALVQPSCAFVSSLGGIRCCTVSSLYPASFEQKALGQTKAELIDVLETRVVALAKMFRKLVDKIKRRDQKQRGSDHTQPAPPTPLPATSTTAPTTAPGTSSTTAPSTDKEQPDTPVTMAKRKRAAQGARDTARYAKGLRRGGTDAITNPHPTSQHPSSGYQSPYTTTNMDDVGAAMSKLFALTSASHHSDGPLANPGYCLQVP